MVDVLINTRINGSENVTRDINNIGDSFTDLDRDVTRNTTSISQNLNQLSTDLATIGAGLSASLTLPIALIGGAAIKMAADAEESNSAFTATFKDLSNETTKWSVDLRSELGLNEVTLRDQATVFKGMFDAMAIPPEVGAEMSRMLTQLSGDIASFNNLKPDEAFLKLRSAIVGESEPLKALGIVVNETAIKNTALTKGIIQQGESLTETQKVYSRYITILELTRDQQGDLGLTSDSVSNKFKEMISRVENLATDFGTELLPAVSKVLDIGLELIDWLGDAVIWFSSLSDETKDTIIKIAALAAALGPLALALAAVIKIFSTLTGVFTTGISTATKLVGVIGLLITAGGFLADNWDKITLIASKVWNTLALGVVRSIDSMLESINSFAGWIPGLSTMIEDARKNIKPFIDEKLVERTKINAIAAAKEATNAIETAKKSIDTSVTDISTKVDGAIEDSVRLATNSVNKTDAMFKDRLKKVDKISKSIIVLIGDEEIATASLVTAYEDGNTDAISSYTKKREKISAKIDDLIFDAEREKVIQDTLVTKYGEATTDITTEYTTRQSEIKESLSKIKGEHETNNSEVGIAWLNSMDTMGSDFKAFTGDVSGDAGVMKESVSREIKEIPKAWDSFAFRQTFDKTFNIDLNDAVSTGLGVVKTSLTDNLAAFVSNGKTLKETVTGIYDDIKGIIIKKLSEIVVSSAFQSVMGFFSDEKSSGGNTATGAAGSAIRDAASSAASSAASDAASNAASSSTAGAAVLSAGPWAAVAIAVYALGSTNAEGLKENGRAMREMAIKFKENFKVFVDNVKANAELLWKALILPWFRDNITRKIDNFFDGLLDNTVGDWLKKIWGALWDVANFIWSKLSAAFERIYALFNYIYSGIKGVWTTIWSAIKWLYNGLYGIIKWVGDMVVSVITAVWAAMKWAYNFISNTLSWIGNGVWGIVSGVANTVWGAISWLQGKLDTIIGAVSSAVWNAITWVYQNLWTTLWAVIKWLYNTVYTVLSYIATGVWNIAGTIVKGIWAAITWLGSAFKGVFTGAVGGIGDFISGLNPFAHGTDQIINKPTMFLAGENGAERITIKPMGGDRSSGGGPITIFNGPVIMDEITSRKFARGQQSLLMQESLRFA